MFHKIVWLLIGTAIVAGCNPVMPIDTVQPTPTEVVMPATAATELPGSQPSDLDLSPEIDLAREDLAARLALTADQIEVVKAEAVVWPDSSLGCPQPDMVYAQMLQDGFLIVLRANNQQYEYHGGGDSPAFLCEEE